MVRQFSAAALAGGLVLAGAAPLAAEPAETRLPLIGPAESAAQGASNAAPKDAATQPAKPDAPIVTGSLSQPSVQTPSVQTPSARTLQGFAAHVEAGAITVRTSTPTGCLPGDLKDVLAAVSARFGPVSIQSTHRDAVSNRRKGGARRSLHIACRAIDFRVRAANRTVLAFLRERPEVGGLKLYRNGLIHIDNGERRTW